MIGRNGVAMPRSAYNLSELLEDQRKEADLTKAAFARKLGIPKQTLHRLLNGQANPTMEFVEALADKLELNFHPEFISSRSSMLDRQDEGSSDQPAGGSGSVISDERPRAKRRPAPDA